MGADGLRDTRLSPSKVRRFGTRPSASRS